MKLAVKNMKWSGFRNAVMAVCLAALAVGCQKAFEMDLPLAVTANTLQLTKDAGSTHILVYSTGKWSATLTENVKWASINKLSGEGNADIVFNYAANYGISRKVGVVFISGGLRDTVTLVQAPSVTEPSLSFTNRFATLFSAATTLTMPVSTNTRYDIERAKVKVTYEGEEDDEIDGWISDITFDAESLTFSAAAYSGGLPRIGYITLSITDAQDTEISTVLTVTQTNSEPQLSITESEATYDGVAMPHTVPVETNLVSYTDQIDYTITYDVPVSEENEWIPSARLTTNGLVFVLLANEGDIMRSATIKMEFEDSEGHKVSATHKVNQKPFPKPITFGDVRAKIAGASGEFVIDSENTLEGFVISDPASANVCISPQTGQFMFDYEENYKTAYIESEDGQYGFCLKFATKADNVLERYSKVKLSLKGLTLVKEAAPARYTIKGLTADNVVEAGSPNPNLLPVKAKTISQLTDDDLFTWVSLQKVEIVYKDGSFTNATDGYSIKDDLFNPQGTATAPRWDVAPLLMTDDKGNVISMLTNAKVPWRRNNSGLLPNGLPKGSGTFNGVVVAEELVRYGDLGRYQMRAMTLSDLAMSDPAFSNTIVEWNWNNKTVDLVPEIGTGTFDNNGATVTGTSDFNNITSNDAQKGLIPNSGIYMAKKWWDFTEDEGEYFDIKFSTSGISGANLTFGFTWNHGEMNNTTLDSPGKWKLLYSTDGGTVFQNVSGAQAIQNRSITWWSTTSQDSCPGFSDFLFKLPNECFNKSEVIVRVQVADKTTDIMPTTDAATWETNLGIGKGTLTDKSTKIRIGALTVRYN